MSLTGMGLDRHAAHDASATIEIGPYDRLYDPDLRESPGILGPIFRPNPRMDDP
jgi:hypothetical protein